MDITKMKMKNNKPKPGITPGSLVSKRMGAWHPDFNRLSHQKKKAIGKVISACVKKNVWEVIWECKVPTGFVSNATSNVLTIECKFETIFYDAKYVRWYNVKISTAFK